MGAAPEFYLEREVNQAGSAASTVERALLERAKAWLTTARGPDWISIHSAPGRGNTSFLKKIQADAATYTYTLGEARFLFIDGAYGSSDQEPARLTPITKAVLESSERKSRLASALLWSRFRVLATVAAGVVLAPCFAFIEALLKEGHRDLFDPEFWRELIRNISRQPRIMLELAVIGTVAAALFEMTVHALAHARSAHQPHQEHPAAESDIESELKKYGGAFFHELRAFCRKHRALVLLVDNAAMLRDKERQFLEDLFAPPPDSPFAEFARQTRLLIVTLDFQVAHEWSAIPPDSPPLDLREFTDLELEMIYSARYPDRGLDKFKEKLEDARRHISLLFDPTAESRKIVQAFNRAGERGRSGEFALQHLMVYWAVRRLTSIERATVADWLRALPADHLAFFGLTAPKGEARKTLLKQFGHCGLVRTIGRFFYFDAFAARTLQSFLKNGRRPELLAQAHLFWAMELGVRALSPPASPPPERSLEETELSIKRGAWHAARITVVLKSPADILRDPGPKSNAARAWRHQVSLLLIEAARISRDEGDLLESDDYISDALDWLSGLGDPVEIDLVSKCTQQLWKNFWTGAESSTRESLADIAARWPPVLLRSEWLVNSQYEDLLHAKISLEPLLALPEGASPELQNLASLNTALLSIRRKHGFLVPALRDPSIPIPQPVDSNSSWPEAALWQLRVASVNRREPEPAAVVNEFAAWRRRLLSLDESASRLGKEARYQYQTARYWHLVCDVWRVRSRKFENKRDAERQAELAALTDLCVTLCLKPPGQGRMPDYCFEQAELCYRRALQFAALLKWRALVIDVTFHFGTLLLQHTPEEARTDDPPWWKAWEELFNSCVGAERKLQWAFHTPAVHRLRWEFFQDVERPTSVVDAYNTFQAVRDSNYPVDVVLAWHATAKTELNNFGNDLEDRRRSATLHELWARELAQLPEALPKRFFKHCLPFERAYTLQFVAQALRKTNELDRAAAVLDEADAFLHEAEQDPAASEEPPYLARQLRTVLRMQRAWLLKQMKHEDQAAALIMEAWRELEPDEYHNPNLLASLVDLEKLNGSLNDPWPPDGSPPFADPDNPRLSLPESWFSGDAPLEIANRFEFRFRQLVRMVTVRPQPSFGEFILNLKTLWPRLDKFGDAVIELARIAQAGDYLKTTKPLMLKALQTATRFFSEVEPDDDHEIACLRLILRFEPNSSQTIILYVRVLRKHVEMMKRELAVRTPAQTDWLELARRADYLFSVLVDSNRLSHEIGEELFKRGISPEMIPPFSANRRQALAAARERFAAGNFEAVAAELEPHLPPKNAQFILVYDLEALDLWLRSAVRFAAQTPLFSERAAQFRDFALRYIGQYSRTASQAEAQHLALEFLDAIGEMTRVPVPPPALEPAPAERAAGHAV